MVSESSCILEVTISMTNGDITPSCLSTLRVFTCLWHLCPLNNSICLLGYRHASLSLRILSYGLFNIILPIKTARTHSASSRSSLYHLTLDLTLLSTLLLSLPTRYSNNFSSIPLPCNNVLTTFILSPPTGLPSFCQTSRPHPRRRSFYQTSWRHLRLLWP